MLPGLRSHARSLAFSADGRRLAAAGYAGTVMVWDVQLGIALRAFPNHAKGLAFSRDGTQLAGCTADGPMVWQLGDTHARTLAGHGSYVYLVAYSPDGSLLASKDAVGEIIFWDPTSGERLATVNTVSLAQRWYFSADGRQLILAGPPAIACDSATGARVATTAASAGPGRPALVPYEIGAWDAASADGRLHASANSEMVFVRNGEGRELRRVPLAPIGVGPRSRAETTRAALADLHYLFAPSLAVRAEPPLVAAGRRDGTVHFIDAFSGEQLAARQRHFGPVYDLAFTPDGAGWRPPATTAPCDCGTRSPSSRSPSSGATRATSKPSRFGRTAANWRRRRATAPCACGTRCHRANARQRPSAPARPGGRPSRRSGRCCTVRVRRRPPPSCAATGP